MAYTEGVFFQNQILTANGLGAFGAGAGGNGVVQGRRPSFTTVSGDIGSITVRPNYFMIGGRLGYTGDEDITLNIDSSNYSLSSYPYVVVLASVFLDNTATASTFQQTTVSLYYLGSLSQINSGLLPNVNFASGGETHYNNSINGVGLYAGETRARAPLYIYDRANQQLIQEFRTGGGCDLLWVNPNPSSAIASETTFTMPIIHPYGTFIMCFASTMGQAITASSDVEFVQNFQGTTLGSTSIPHRAMTTFWDSGTSKFRTITRKIEYSIDGDFSAARTLSVKVYEPYEIASDGSGIAVPVGYNSFLIPTAIYGTNMFSQAFVKELGD